MIEPDFVRVRLFDPNDELMSKGREAAVMTEEIRKVITVIPKLQDIVPGVAADTDLWDAGMDSMTSVQMMMLLEDHFGVELPERALTRETFASIRSLEAVLVELLNEKKAVSSD
ncbi:acyl carrier protein [Kitasatospora sp. NBC_01287]|uniref:acyl carrier protein n=1 Tax=Kitasatospora sp. NBC_01287 TaxID=2903573 RepID=UPI00224E5237|nr:acyl carrier protein [Kitasatospora sp. NBC_01287]MCX4745037.1 acyl carrier protein [Kitasatospora sp. NBC_01287]